MLKIVAGAGAGPLQFVFLGELLPPDYKVQWSKFCKILEISWQVLSGNIIFSSGCPLNI